MITIPASGSAPLPDEPQWDSSAADLVIRAPAFNPSTPCHKVFRLLEQHPQWPALAVIDETGQVAGLVARVQCLSILSKPLMLDLYSKRPVERIMHRAPLAVDVGENIDSILQRLADDGGDALINGFIVTENGTYIGVATAQALLVKSVEQARHRSEALDMARRQAEDANLAKSSFLANISHEIRTPLNGVLANLELLGLTSADTEQAELIGSAAIAAQALFEIIGDVLDLSKIEAGKLLIETIDMRPAPLLQDIATMVATQAGQRDLSFTSHLSPAAWATVRGDPTRLRQILMNLCGNALKFTKAGGLFLSLFQHERPDGRMELWIEIADTGTGFASHKAEQLFEAFTQEDATTTRKFGGTGLGLSICRYLTELMGGSIQADGEPGGGATFWCRIPFPVVTPADGALADIAGLSVMIVDAARGRRERLAGALISGGAIAATLPTLEAAARQLRLAAVAGRPFDAVLIVPKDDGAEMAAVLPQIADLPTVPVMVTALEDVRLRRAGFRHGIRYWTVLSASLSDTHATIAAATGRMRPSAAKTQTPDMAALIQSLVPLRAARILVIDDTPMNQQVARRQLAKLGFTCDIADNGLDGLERATTRPYDLVFSDIQMPEMDGYAFVRRLRQWEAGHGGARTPVIAMTANALGGDDQRCLAAGMDDYIAKPVKIERLGGALARWLPGPPESAAGQPADDMVALPGRPEPPAASCPVDFAVLSEQLGDDTPGAHREILDMFLEFYPPLEQALAEAIDARDRAMVRTRAHTAKGAALNTAAMALGAILHRMEAVAHQADWHEVAALMDGARRECRRVEGVAAEFRPPDAITTWEARRVPA